MTDAHSTRLKGCENCCAQFTSIIPKARYCSDKCQRAHYRKTKHYGPFTCSHCHAEFYRRDNRRDTFCGRACNFAHRRLIEAEVGALYLIAQSVRRGRSRRKGQVDITRASRIGIMKRNARIRMHRIDRIDPIKVFERDRWRCHICQKKTKRELRGSASKLAPELDHVLPIARGGSHTWGNVACSCRGCNRSKGSTPFGQLGLGFAA